MPKKEILERYNEKRDFEKTPEPEGVKKPVPTERLFVIQEHHATRLHYDFRMSIGGVLKSWAVPRGIPTKTNEKRLAVETEDHPLEYANFEGHIPEGLYGAGDVIIWDKGQFRNLKGDVSMPESLGQGQATFWLDGKKAKGAFALIRTRMGEKGEKQWLLIKLDNKKATGNLFEAKKKVSLLKDKKHNTQKSNKSSREETGRRREKVIFSDKPEGERKAAQPEWIDPMLATLTSERFSDENWIYERKFDGERCIVFRKGKSVRLASRNRKLVSGSYPGAGRRGGEAGSERFYHRWRNSGLRRFPDQLS